MYLVLYCHNIGSTDFSFFETEDFDPDEGYVVRGKWPNEQAFRDYLNKEFGDMSDYKVIDLITQGAQAETLDTKALAELAEQL